MGTDAQIVRPYNRYTSPEKIEIASVENGKPPRRDEIILRKFDLLLPKFDFILPNFYFGPPWGKFVCSLEIDDFLGRDCNRR